MKFWLWRCLRMLPSCPSTPLQGQVTALCLWKDGTLKFPVGEVVLSAPPPPPPICILPLGVPSSREPLHDPAGKLQRCLSPCCFSLSLQKQHAFYLFICCIGFKHCQVTLRQISAGHRGDHTFANFMLPTLHGKGCVRDGVADGERCERCDCSRVAAVVGVAVCSPIAALFS